MALRVYVFLVFGRARTYKNSGRVPPLTAGADYVKHEAIFEFVLKVLECVCVHSSPVVVR